MKILLIGLLAIVSVSAFAESNYLAENLKDGTEVSILKDIHFMPSSTGGFIQKGEAFRTMNGFDSSGAYCSYSAFIEDYDSETRTTKPIKAGEKYKVTEAYNNGSSRGRIFITIESAAGRIIMLDCQKSSTIVTKAADATGIPVYMDNLARLRIKTVKKILAGLMEIQD
jgi:hypothetical protein